MILLTSEKTTKIRRKITIILRTNEIHFLKDGKKLTNVIFTNETKKKNASISTNRSQ